MALAVSSALAEVGIADGALLRSSVSLARAVFDAAACSILLLDRMSDELIFAAVSGEGEDFLVGTRFAADRGIAGWVAASGEPMAVDDLAGNGLFARDVAESTGYVPTSMMVAPVLCDGEVLAVVEVLDPGPPTRSRMGDLDLLIAMTEQLGLALRDRYLATTALEHLATGEAGSGHVNALIGLLMHEQPERRAAGRRLVDALADVLGTQ
jgi:GAF domain-containing protein